MLILQWRGHNSPSMQRDQRFPWVVHRLRQKQTNFQTVRLASKPNEGPRKQRLPVMGSLRPFLQRGYIRCLIKQDASMRLESTL